MGLAGADTVQQLFDALQRYSDGSIGSVRRPGSGRRVALGDRADARGDPGSLASDTRDRLARLPGGELRKMLRATAGQFAAP